ncbi:MAG: hypothetical protein COT28_21735 [Methylobacterium sp. CG08_land_8_20_14_0_20_71_15]|nr:MAG: hypothetical protein COT56_09525 [Methylobacterium sp. CG09_land_8_20_14_0_10_71_15]PIU11106.1 MAG: hypothetical protein COT28_21735 [Methylobacterium sp. CG08_land_8_20_14_0_20_71_15]
MLEGKVAAPITVSDPFIDKISIVVKPASEAEAVDIHNALWVAFYDKGTFNKAGPEASKGYQDARFVHLDSTAARPLIQYRGHNGKAELIRLEFNPRKLGEDGFVEFGAYMDSVVPDGWEYVVTNGHVTRIDVAVDVTGVRIGDLLCLPKQGLTSTTWGVDGHAQTIHLGKKGNQTSIYNVKAKRLTKKQKWTGPTKIRIERRLRNPEFHGLADLAKLANPFAGLVMTKPLPPPAPGMKTWEWAMFGDSVQVRGLTAALALLPKERRLKYRAYLKSHPQPWWQPADLWEHWQEIVEESRLTAFKP